MLKRWGRNVWRYLEPRTVHLVWLDPAIAAACWSPEPQRSPGRALDQPRPSRPMIVPRKEPRVA